jgi:K+-transporting ATPase KdpF subunit
LTQAASAPSLQDLDTDLHELNAALTRAFLCLLHRNKISEPTMDLTFLGLYWISGLAALGLFIYLLYALLRAEEF